MLPTPAPTPEQRYEWAHSGKDGSFVAQADIDISFQRILEAEKAEQDWSVLDIVPLTATLTSRQALLPAPRVWSEWTTDHSPRSGSVQFYQLHHAATTSLRGILNLFKPGGRTVSANGAIKDDELVNTVPENRRAWTSGSDYVDSRSITREVANSAVGGSWPVSNRTFHTIAWDIAQFSIKYKRTINRSNVITHQEIPRRWPGQSYATACPGDLQRRMDELIDLAKRYHAAAVGAPSGAAPAAPAETGAQGTLEITTWPRAVYALKKGDSQGAVLEMFGMGQARFRNLNGKPNGWGKGEWPVGLRVQVALDYAPLTYQYLQTGQSWGEAPLVLATAQVQRRLKAAYPSYAGALVIDGKYGKATESAVAEFQRRTDGLGASGRVDRNTWNAIHALNQKPEGVTVTIKKGDTLWSLAKTHGTSVAAIEKLNPGVDASALVVGSKLRVR